MKTTAACAGETLPSTSVSSPPPLHSQSASHQSSSPASPRPPSPSKTSHPQYKDPASESTFRCTSPPASGRYQSSPSASPPPESHHASSASSLPPRAQ